MASISTPSVSETATVMPDDDPSKKGTGEDTALTPIRAHYLKKTLISLQFASELSGLTQVSPNPAVSPLSYLGLPFTPPPKDATMMDFPFMRFMFRQFVLTFPFLASAPKDFFSHKVQPFISSVLSRNLSTSSPFEEEAEETEKATREKILTKIEKQFSTLLGSAAKLVEDEEVVRLTQKDLQQLETLARRRRARMLKYRDSFDVNIIGVRTITDKGRVRSKAHEEFIIQTKQAHRPDIFVSRRYGDFKTLVDELRKAYPDLTIPSPPAKDRSTVIAPATPMTPSYTPHTQTPSDSTEAFSPVTRTETFNSVDIPSSPSGAYAARLSREKNRLTLRAYLNTLLSSSKIASSPILKSFLTSGAIRLSSAEIEDARRRQEADQVREEGRKRFSRELAVKVDALRDAMKSVKRNVMGKNGLLNAFSVIKSAPDVRDLPPDFKAVLEWARISLASTIFHHFVASDSASESFASLKRLHGLMPYFVLKGILKVSNPIAMIRGVLDLFLAQPFGGRSLLQRMFTSSLAEEVKALQEDIEAVQDKVEDPVLCEKMRLFVYAPSEIQAMFKADAAEEKLAIITVVLRSSEEPRLSRAQLQRIARSQRAHAEYKRYKDSLEDSDDDDGPQNDDAWLYEDLTILGKLYTRLRDRQQLMELMFEGTTADLLKDIITIFYTPLAQVYKAASIADSLGDLQNFVNDLIRTVEQTEADNADSASTVKTFVNLVQRHEQAFYTFVHKVHSKGAGLFDNLLRWIELFLNFVREGLGEPISLEFLLPHTGVERMEILREVDAVALYHYRLKVAHETKVRRRFDRGEGSSAEGDRQMTADEEDEATQALINDVVRDLSFGDLVQGDTEDFVGDDSSSSEEESSEYESTSEMDSVSDSEENENAQNPRSMAPQPSATKRPFPSAPLPYVPLPSARSSFDVSPPQKPNEPKSSRKRAFSFKSTKSSVDLRQKSKSELPVPPLLSLIPPIPQTNTPLTPTLPQRSPAPSGSFASNTSLPRSIQRRKTVDGLKNLSLNTSQSDDALQRGVPPPVPRRKKKKQKQGSDIGPPELKAIPVLLPLFVEVMRPQLRPRQV